MKEYRGRLLICIIVAISGFLFKSLNTAALTLGLIYVLNILIASKDYIAFREYILGIYALNYLISPALLYPYNDSDFLPYKMKCDEDLYFTNAILGMISLHFGMFLFKAKVFNLNFKLSGIQEELNLKVFRSWIIIGIGLLFVLELGSFPGELTIFILLLSNIRYLGAIALFSINQKKYFKELFFVLFLEISKSLKTGFFHDLLIWFIFLGLYYVYKNKVNLLNKVVLCIVFIILGYTLQNVKGLYREKLYTAEGEDNALQNMIDVTKARSSEASFLSKESMLQNLIRVNQGWIAASAIEKAERTGELAGTELLYKYIESAILPRFLAPNKLEAGNKEIFNKYSGHIISKNTSMGLGVIADGYIAMKTTGVILYCFLLGLLFCCIFLLVSSWTDITPFFGLMIFPILYYGVRPDCELQLTLGQLFKGTFIFWLIRTYYKSYFEKQTKILQKIELLIQRRKIETLNRFKNSKTT